MSVHLVGLFGFGNNLDTVNGIDAATGDDVSARAC